MHTALRPVLGLVLAAGSLCSLGAPCAQAQIRPEGPTPVDPQLPDSLHVRGAQKKPEPKDRSPEFVTLSNAWMGAFRDYSQALIDYDRMNGSLPAEKRDPKGPPRHPAPLWWKRFEDLGKAGDPDALLWLIQQAPNAHSEPAARASAAERAFDELLRAHPEHRTIEDAFDELRPLYDDFGRERFLALVKRAHAAVRGEENLARALVVEAWALTDRFRDNSPALQPVVQQLYDEVLLGHPGTRAAREIAGKVYASLNREFLKAELAWIDTVRELQKQGKQPKDWPRQPMHVWNEKYLPVAAAGGPEALEFTENIYPGYQQAEGNGMGFGLVWLQTWWMLHESMSNDDWSRARMGLLEIVTRQYHGQGLVTSALVDLSRDALRIPVKYLDPALEPVLADDSAPKAQALALFSRALAHSAQNQWADWQSARADLDALLARFPTEEVATRAQALRQSLLKVWPGTPAPDFRGNDQDGLAFKLEEYRGLVCVVDFVTAAEGLDPESVAHRKELVEAFAGRPFRWIGGYCEPRTTAMFRDTLDKAGVRWRVARIGSRSSDVAAGWSLQKLPAVFLVDAAGVIRARNLPWAELKAEIERLVSETEKAREKH